VAIRGDHLGRPVKTGSVGWSRGTAEVAVQRKLFAAILERIQRLRRPEVGLVPSG